MPKVRPWQVLSERTLVERRWLKLREQRVGLPNGHEIDEFHLIEGPDWAAVLPLTDDGSVVLVRQYRHGIGRASLELPAGVIEPGENAAAAVERELLEETGYAARSFEPLLAVSTEPARHTTQAHLFVARGAHALRAAEPEPSELIDVELHPAASLEDLVVSGEILHGVHVAAIFLALRRGLLSVAPGSSARSDV